MSSLETDLVGHVLEVRGPRDVWVGECRAAYVNRDSELVVVIEVSSSLGESKADRRLAAFGLNDFDVRRVERCWACNAWCHPSELEWRGDQTCHRGECPK